MLRQVVNYQKALWLSTYSFSGMSKDWRRSIPDYLSFVPLVLSTLIFGAALPQFWFILSGIVFAISFYDGRIRGNSYFEYLPVKRGFKVMNFYVWLFVMMAGTLVVTAASMGFLGCAALVAVTVLVEPVGVNELSMAFSMGVELLEFFTAWFSIMLVSGSLVLTTCFLKRFTGRLLARLVLAGVILWGGYWLSQTEGFLGITDFFEFTGQYGVGISGIAVLVFMMCLCAAVLLQQGKRQA
ncbi:MAG: hypothetical protein FWF88_05170 [Peptococcaceae bacterium]|nr:hypothetical protein [Peptococcaceae bacterium]